VLGINSFVAEEPALAPEPASVAGERGVTTDQPVARDDDRYRILAIGGPHRARRRAVPDGPCEGSVAPGAARPDPAQGLPDSPLERRAAGVDRDAIERGEISGQIGADPRAETERVPRPDPPRSPVSPGQGPDHAGSSELERAQATVADRDHDTPDRALDLVDEDGGCGRCAHVILNPGLRQT